MKNKQQGFLVPLLIIIIAALAIGGGIYLHKKNKQTNSTSVSTNATATTTETTTTTQNSNSQTNLASNVNVSGMTQYTDKDFGFSFWYPSSWNIQTGTNRTYLNISGGNIIKTIQVLQPGQQGLAGVGIMEFVSSDKSIIDKSPSSPAGNGSASLKYFFDPTTHTWMSQDTDGEYNVFPVQAVYVSTSTNTMGGLHMFGGNARFGDDVIIPLSAEHFLVVYALDAGGTQERWLANTITATDPSVATPVNTSTQGSIVIAEGLKYGVTGTNIGQGEWFIYNNQVYDSQGNLIIGANASTFKTIDTYTNGKTVVGTSGFATDGIHVYLNLTGKAKMLQNADPNTFVLIDSGDFIIEYEKDKSHVWYEDQLIPGADPTTFVETGTDTARDAYHIYGIDKNNKVTIDGVTVTQ